MYAKLIVIIFLLFDSTLKLSNKQKEDEEFKSKYALLYPTFLGNEQRNFYGKDIPDTIDLLWKVFTGCGKTRVGKKTYRWCGTGWPGQPILVKELGQGYIIIGCLDHKLRKLDAETGKEIWNYKFDDVIKGSATIFCYRDSLNEKIIILQGSRRGFGKSLYSKIVPSFRAIDLSGKELWRLNIKRTDSYSRDVDASPLVLDSLIYLGAENGIFYIIDADPNMATMRRGIVQPKILKEIKLYDDKDIKIHGGNLVAESSPVLCQNKIYIAAGSGHVYGINLETLKIDWDFYIGSDLDGTISVTQDNCLIVPVEKQYIKEKGGVLKLDPSKDAEESVVWYFPTEDKKFASWRGGVIGSVSIQDSLIAFRAIDGYLYLANHYLLDNNAQSRLNGKKYPMPKLLAKVFLGPSISTPLIIDDKIITAGYDNKLRILKVDRMADITEIAPIDSFVAQAAFESTPLVWQNRIYIGCKDGYFYCLGEK